MSATGGTPGDALRRLGRPALEALAEALAAGRVAPPYGGAALAPFTKPKQAVAAAAALEALAVDGMAPRHIAWALRMVVAERSASQAGSDRLELVWSPPDLDEVDCRETAVVVQELFARAKRRVLVVTFVLDQGAKAQALFGALAKRMDAEPALSVRIVANITRPYGDETPTKDLVRAFAERLRDKVWPGERLPEVYYYPRALEPDAKERAVLHAKCVVVDGRFTLVTSANFTDAAHHRNIEAGVLVDDARLAARLTLQLDRLIEAGILIALPSTRELLGGQ